MHYEARFIPTPDDIVTGYRMRHRLGDDLLKLCMFAAALVAVVFGVAAYLMAFPVVGILGALLVPVAFIPAAMVWNVRRVARKWPQEEMRFLISDAGVEVHSSVAQTKYTWSVFTKASLDDRGLLLFVHPEVYSFIPARAFTSGYFPRHELKALLSAKLRDA